ncbi:MAG: branched-chain amino acid transaminase [Chloroflexaceae bacterium]|nr:branched-chain amino acid transaminase [Chloroflexaceae bacterium]
MALDLLPYAYFEGQFVPIEEARVSLTTHALQYGTGVFGGIRGYLAEDGSAINIFRLPDHFRRLRNSARMVKINLPYGVEDLCELAIELTRRNEPTSNVYYRPFAYKSGQNLAPTMYGVADEFAIFMTRLNEYYTNTSGLQVMVSSWQRLPDVAIPSRAKISGSYINSSLANTEAKEYGFDEAIMLNERGKVSEGSASNLFLVRDGVLITTPVTASILEGITRRSIIQIARDMGIPFEEREVDRSELYIADELFFCGTGVQISGIGEVDKRPVGEEYPGPIMTALRNRFLDVVKGKVPEYREWLTPVPIASPIPAQ